MIFSFLKAPEENADDIPSPIAALDLKLRDALSHALYMYTYQADEHVLDVLMSFAVQIIDLDALEGQGLEKTNATHIVNFGYKFGFDKIPPDAYVQFRSSHILQCGEIILPPPEWQKYHFPEELKKLNLSYTNYCGDLTYLINLELLNLTGVVLDDWSEFMFPYIKLKQLILKETNFTGDLSDLETLENLQMGRVKMKNFSSFVFPFNLKCLELQSTDCGQDFSYLEQLEVLNMGNVQLESWENIRFPRSLKTLNLVRANFDGNMNVFPSECRIIGLD